MQISSLKKLSSVKNLALLCLIQFAATSACHLLAHYFLLSQFKKGLDDYLQDPQPSPELNSARDSCYQGSPNFIVMSYRYLVVPLAVKVSLNTVAVCVLLEGGLNPRNFFRRPPPDFLVWINIIESFGEYVLYQWMLNISANNCYRNGEYCALNADTASGCDLVVKPYDSLTQWVMEHFSVLMGLAFLAIPVVLGALCALETGATLLCEQGVFSSRPRLLLRSEEQGLVPQGATGSPVFGTVS